jgi:hypothetical protein
MRPKLYKKSYINFRFLLYIILSIFVICIIYLIYYKKIKENYQNNNNNNNLKIIVLIISSNNTNEYKNMHKIWEKYMNNHPNIKSFFIENNKFLENEVILNNGVFHKLQTRENPKDFPHQVDPLPGRALQGSAEKNTIYCKGNENYIPGILNKTIKSINYCINNFDFDYIYRTNLSTVLNLDKLYEYTQNNKVNYAGKIYGNFISGSGILLSKEACTKLSNDKSLIDNEIIDDVSIGNVLNKYYKMENINFYHVKDLNDEILHHKNLKDIDNKIFQFRCRIAYEHTNTAFVMSKIYKKIYE